MQGKTTDISNSSNFSRTKSTKKSGSAAAPATSSFAVPSKVSNSISPAPASNSIKMALVQSIPETCPFQELVDEWLECCHADGLSPKTRLDYADKLVKFRWWWVEHSKQPAHPKLVTTRDARAFAAYLREPLGFRWGMEVPKHRQELSPASVLAYGRTVKVFFNWLERENYIEQSPFNKSVKFTTKKHDRIIKDVSQENLNKIFNILSQEASKGSYHGLRNLAIVALLLDSGMRRGELLSMKLSQIDFKGGKCLVNGKTGPRYALFSDTCKRSIARYFKRWRSTQDDNPASPFWLTEDGEPLSYNGFGSMIRRLEKESGVDFHAHKLRHTFATMMAQQGTNVFDLKELMGHSNISTTQIYVQANVAHLTRVHREKSPLTMLTSAQDRVKRRRGRPRKQE